MCTYASNAHNKRQVARTVLQGPPPGPHPAPKLRDDVHSALMQLKAACDLEGWARVAFSRYAQVITARSTHEDSPGGLAAYTDVQALNAQGLRELLFEFGRHATPEDLSSLISTHSTLEPPSALAWPDTCELLGLPRSTRLMQPRIGTEKPLDEIVVNIHCMAAIGLRVMLRKDAVTKAAGIDKDSASGPGTIVWIDYARDQLGSEVTPVCVCVRVRVHVRA